DAGDLPCPDHGSVYPRSGLPCAHGGFGPARGAGFGLGGAPGGVTAETVEAGGEIGCGAAEALFADENAEEGGVHGGALGGGQSDHVTEARMQRELCEQRAVWGDAGAGIESIEGFEQGNSFGPGGG